MRSFEIIDGSRRGSQPCATLVWDERENSVSVELSPDANEADVPMMFVPFVRKGQLLIDGHWAWRWVEERIVPTGRQNLGEVLRANGLQFYDSMRLFISGEGRCSQDDFFIREIKEGGKNEKTAVFRACCEVKSAREDAGMSQVELASRAGLRQSAVSRLECGKTNPTVGLLEDIAKALGKELEVRFV